ncbi:MAG: hypothetical protein KGI97_03200 [Alphaproteobacteria bacterium]|nr:hypothetical protein [Alphaproteobacteria bacterium]
MKSRLAKFLAILLVVTLVFGQGMPVMAMPMMSADQMSMDMAGMDMSASTNQSSKDCCGHADKDKGMKACACCTCCAAMAQAMLPSQYAAPVQYAVAYSYDPTDTAAVSKTMPPEPPPPKA